MNEVQTGVGKQTEAVLAIQNLGTAKMGQTSSSNSSNKQSSRRASTSLEKSSSGSHIGRTPKLQYRHSMAASDRYAKAASSGQNNASHSHGRRRDSPPMDGLMPVAVTKGAIIDNSIAGTALRPITIGEMNAYNAASSSSTAPAVTPKKLLNSSSSRPAATNSNSKASSNNNNSNINNNNSQNHNNNGSSSSSSNSSTGIATTKSSSKNNQKNEFYTVGEGYHKTDSCYYKTPDGGYHKLPPDSYHKMSEVCYTKMPDGKFRRLGNSTLSNNVSMPSDTGSGAGIFSSTQPHNKVRHQIIRFLKRSKSHTPSTMKERQTAKDKVRDQMHPNQQSKHHRMSAMEATKSTNAAGMNASATPANHHHQTHGHSNIGNTGSRKVVVTMMENGGLPIVATSKTSNKRDHSVRESIRNEHSTKHKASLSIAYVLIASFKNKKKNTYLSQLQNCH